MSMEIREQILMWFWLSEYIRTVSKITHLKVSELCRVYICVAIVLFASRNRGYKSEALDKVLDCAKDITQKKALCQDIDHILSELYFETRIVTKETLRILTSA